ncbi:50S ribosomal protein L9 [bacterium]|nr:50S ribosomal protein L9 [bacterium]
MEVILRKNLNNLGSRGDVVTVKDGYARNYLIPRGMAMKVTKGAKRQIDIERAASDRKLLTQRELHKGLIAKIEGQSFTVAARVSDSNRLYGSVGENEVVELLGMQGIEIERSQVRLDDHIKSIGVFNVPVRFQADLIAQMKIWIVAEDQGTQGLPEEAPEPQLFVGGSQSLSEAAAHVGEIESIPEEEDEEASEEVPESADETESVQEEAPVEEEPETE